MPSTSSSPEIVEDPYAPGAGVEEGKEEDREPPDPVVEVETVLSADVSDEEPRRQRDGVTMPDTQDRIPSLQELFPEELEDHGEDAHGDDRPPRANSQRYGSSDLGSTTSASRIERGDRKGVRLAGPDLSRMRTIEGNYDELSPVQFRPE